MSSKQIAKRLNDFMIARKVNVALRLLSETEFRGLFPTNNQTTDPPKEKHRGNIMKFEDLPEEFFEEYT